MLQWKPTNTQGIDGTDMTHIVGEVWIGSH